MNGASVYYRNFEGCTIKLNGASVYYFGCSHSFVDVVVGCGGFGFWVWPITMVGERGRVALVRGKRKGNFISVGCRFWVWPLAMVAGR